MSHLQLLRAQSDAVHSALKSDLFFQERYTGGLTVTRYFVARNPEIFFIVRANKSKSTQTSVPVSSRIHLNNSNNEEQDDKEQDVFFVKVKEPTPDLFDFRADLKVWDDLLKEMKEEQPMVGVPLTYVDDVMLPTRNGHERKKLEIQPFVKNSKSIDRWFLELEGDNVRIAELLTAYAALLVRFRERFDLDHGDASCENVLVVNGSAEGGVDRMDLRLVDFDALLPGHVDVDQGIMQSSDALDPKKRVLGQELAALAGLTHLDSDLVYNNFVLNIPLLNEYKPEIFSTRESYKRAHDDPKEFFWLMCTQNSLESVGSQLARERWQRPQSEAEQQLYVQSCFEENGKICAAYS